MKTRSGKYKVLVVDDEPLVIGAIQKLLEDQVHIEVIGCATGSEALERVRKAPHAYALILMDYRLPGLSGSRATEEILKLNPDQIVAMNSGDESRDAALESWRAGAVDFIEKHSDPSVIISKILGCLQKYIESSEVFQEASPSEIRTVIESAGLVGASPELAQVVSVIKKSSESQAPVLITGESGVGKDAVARAFHRCSKRSAMNFVAENVNAVPKDLFEPTLFGHVKGSFTGAMFDSVGLFKKAHMGTMFLDEIGDLAPDLQVKLLRALQSGEFYPVGSNKLEQVNVRFIAATNANLEKAIAEKRFREDLYYRLNIIRVHIPPLRERIEDIRPLVEHFRRNQKGNQKVIMMDVIEKFERYPWPGNVRELFTELTRLFELNKGDAKITLKHLDSKFFVSDVKSLRPKILTYDELRNQHRAEEISLIQQHIRRFKNVRVAASEGLKIPYSTLFSRMKSLGLTNEPAKEV